MCEVVCCYCFSQSGRRSETGFGVDPAAYVKTLLFLSIRQKVRNGRPLQNICSPLIDTFTVDFCRRRYSHVNLWRYP